MYFWCKKLTPTHEHPHQTPIILIKDETYIKPENEETLYKIINSHTKQNINGRTEKMSKNNKVANIH